MFHMMNEARLGVGMGAVSLGYTGYLKSLEYARERPQGRPVTAKDPSAPQIPIIEHPDVKRMLLAQKAYVEGGLALALYCAKLVDMQHSAESDDERDATTLLLDILTPVGKSWPSQWCLAANDLAIQVHGGYGYTREYDVEQHYRDNRLNPIHEGTHGIQSLDLLGRKVTGRGGASLAAVGTAISETIDDATAVGGETAELAGQLDATWQRLVAVTTAMFGSGDVEAALANSVVYLEAFGHIVVAWIWLEQLVACNGRSGDFYDGKRQAARYFFRYELPKTAPQLDLLESLDRTTLEMRDDLVLTWTCLTSPAKREAVSRYDFNRTRDQGAAHCLGRPFHAHCHAGHSMDCGPDQQAARPRRRQRRGAAPGKRQAPTGRRIGDLVSGDRRALRRGGCRRRQSAWPADRFAGGAGGGPGCRARLRRATHRR